MVGIPTLFNFRCWFKLSLDIKTSKINVLIELLPCSLYVGLVHHNNGYHVGEDYVSVSVILHMHV